MQLNDSVVNIDRLTATSANFINDF